MSSTPLSIGTRSRASLARLAEQLRKSPYIVRWLVLGTLIGATAGLVVVAFAHAITFSNQVLLRDLGGYSAPTAFASGDHPGSLHLTRAWALPLLVGAGGLLAGIVTLFAPEVRGSGTDVAIDAANGNPRSMRLRSIPAKIVASAFTIGSGGSGGPEGPSAQVAAGVGSALTRALDLTPGDGRIAVAIGLGAGIGCVFRAPLGGAILSAEILYRQDSEVQVIIPSTIASIIAYTVFSIFEGFSPLMGFSGQSYVYRHPSNLLWFLLIGLLGAAVGIAYAKTMSVVRRFAGRLGSSKWATILRPALGGVAVGALAIGMPGVLGAGNGWTQRALGIGLLALPLWFVLMMPLAKIAATSLTVGSGGSGGLFSPGMLIGAYVGAACWRLLHAHFHAIPNSPAAFVIVGMMCCLGSIARAPLAITVMAAEMTSAIGVIAPALLAVGVATMLVGYSDITLIDAQLRSRDDTPGRRLVSGMPMLEGIPVSDVMRPPTLVLRGQETSARAYQQITALHVPGAPVTDEQDLFVGIVTDALLRDAAGTSPDTPVGRIANREAPTTSPDGRLSVALASMIAGETSWLPALDSQRHVTGILTNTDIVRGYRHVLAASMRRLSQISSATSALEVTVPDGSDLTGRQLSEIALPPGSVIVTISRGDDLLAPSGASSLQAGDVLNALVPEAAREAFLRLFRVGNHDPAAPLPEDSKDPSTDT